VYWATYDADGVRLSGPEVSKPADLPAHVRQGPVAGSGPELYPDVFTDARLPVYPSAATLVRLAAADLAAGRISEPQPLYLRRPDVTMPKQRKSVTP
jgi:tRNA A37 threonylcarbamoyladenosine modification protein TsaB